MRTGKRESEIGNRGSGGGEVEPAWNGREERGVRRGARSGAGRRARKAYLPHAWGMFPNATVDGVRLNHLAGNEHTGYLCFGPDGYRVMRPRVHDQGKRNNGAVLWGAGVSPIGGRAGAGAVSGVGGLRTGGFW
ncbi:hypothetical protein MMC13_001538 [Lambiella insularis]|nr:hypothetical protein [Lambiella insularis]